MSAFAQAREAFEKAVQHMRDADIDAVGAVTRAGLEYRLAEVCERAGDLELAVEVLEVCFASARRTSPLLAAKALILLGRVRLQRGQYDDALAASTEGLALAEGTADKATVALALRRLGQCQWQRGDPSTARATLDKSLAAYRELNDRRGIANLLGELGAITFGQRDYPAAQAAFNDALKKFRELADRHSEAVYVGNLGVIDEEHGDLSSARSRYTEALAISREIGVRKDIAIGAINIGDLLAKEGDVAGALKSYRECLFESRAIGSLRIVLAALRGLAWVYLRSGGPDRAGELLGLVTRHPASNSDVLRAAGPVLAEARAAMGESALDGALARGAGLDLDRAVTEELNRTP